MAITTFDARQPIALDGPEWLKPGDWLEDLGTLRQVDSVYSIDTVHVAHFRYQAGIPNMALGICSGVRLTVWRETGSE